MSPYIHVAVSRCIIGIRREAQLVTDLNFPDYVRGRMSQRHVSEADIYHVVGDADDVLHRDDGRTDYTRLVDDGRELRVIVKDDGVTVVSVWDWKRRRPRRP
jgi:hypothetical protein